MSKAVLFQTIQFSISTQFSSIWPIDRTLSDATTPGQCRPGNIGNEGVLHIPQSSSITGTSPSDCLVSYIQDTHCGCGSYPSAEKQSVYSTAPADWAIHFFKTFSLALGECSQHTNYNWYHCSLHAPQLFQFSSKIQVFVGVSSWCNG